MSAEPVSTALFLSCLAVVNIWKALHNPRPLPKCVGKRLTLVSQTERMLPHVFAGRRGVGVEHVCPTAVAQLCLRRPLGISLRLELHRLSERAAFVWVMRTSLLVFWGCFSYSWRGFGDISTPCLRQKTTSMARATACGCVRRSDRSSRFQTTSAFSYCGFPLWWHGLDRVCQMLAELLTRHNAQEFVCYIPLWSTFSWYVSDVNRPDSVQGSIYTLNNRFVSGICPSLLKLIFGDYFNTSRYRVFLHLYCQLGFCKSRLIW